MKSNSVVFIAFEQRENLGIRYMHAMLSEHAYDVQILDFRKEKSEILQELLKTDPLVLGFSVIFEHYIYEFQELIAYLREGGMHCHFTAGGHFASLRPGELFSLFPSLDSIVRFEGEHTILELVNCLKQQNEWTGIQGLSYRKDGKVLHTPLRALEPHLDTFPFPYRSKLKDFALGKKYASLIAGRGCVHNCAFCDIKAFYGQPPGPVKRIRNPTLVVSEMEHLYKEEECSIFLFQDDDFPVVDRRNQQWINIFCRSLEEKELVGKIMWKINCRPDEVDAELFGLMKQHGLFKVYLGIENGRDQGLAQMNKQLTVADNIRGIEVLKKLGIGIDYSFMLFQPDSNYQSLRENLAFLEQVCGDGSIPVNFLKMMPYLATKVEKDLRLAGRLKGQPGFLDYDFLETSMDGLYAFVSECFASWFHAANGATNLTKWGVSYLAVYRFFYGEPKSIAELSEELKERVAEANHFIIHSMRRLSDGFEDRSYCRENNTELEAIRADIFQRHSTICKSLREIISKVGLYARTRDVFHWE
jgi:radical SAM superfamily enzyme YgiQ (UPF0313 family)